MDAGDDQGSQDDGGDDDRPQRNDRYERDRPQPRESRDRYEGPDRNERPERDARPERSERPERNDRPQAAERNPRRPRYARDDRNGEEAADRGGNAPLAASPESIAFDALPPAIGRVDAVEPDNPEDAPRPKRRAVRKPRATGGDTDAAPAG
ncbi:hypothetical protein [Sphingomonas sp.]|uniref:hypothetical protein n=1 Tax=Sphingomonas sp. TaxID=28214 RepID=UPI00286C5927|nr:hypothetical protein [Sphingomonas sp.]